MKTYKIFLGLAGVAMMAAGCSALSTAPRPTNKVIPTLSFAARMARWNQGADDDSVAWLKQFCGELKSMDGWAPQAGWVKSTECLRNAIFTEVTNEDYPKEYLADMTNISKGLQDASGYFIMLPSTDERGLTNNFISMITTNPASLYSQAAGLMEIPTNGVPMSGKLNLVRLAADMLLRVDDEHQTLLTDQQPTYHERGMRLFSASPRMVSLAYPVGVSVAVLTPPDAPKDAGQTNSPVLVTINNYVQTMPGGTNAPAAKAPEKADSEVSTVEEFDRFPKVNLSISTALNSADVLDRIEYVTTCIYIYPYPEPANGSVSINNEFWKRFFARQIVRQKAEREAAMEADLAASFDRMRVRFRNVTTTVLTKDLVLGQVVRSTEDDLAAALSASIPVAPATVNPSGSATSKVTSQTTTQLQRQLDQRSAYVSGDGAFLRITQRGMTSVNLNGRFNEQVQLSIPAAQDPLYVIEPGEKGVGLQIKTMMEPLYSEVDALTVSVVVVRHPTKLRRSSYETFGLALEDAANEDFIVGLARPSKVILWQWKREIDNLYTSDLDSATTNIVPICFDSESAGLYDEKPLRLAGFDDAQMMGLVSSLDSAIRKQNYTNKNLIFKLDQDGADKNGSFISVTDTNGFTLRLGRKVEGSNELKSFSPLANYFPLLSKRH